MFIKGGLMAGTMLRGPQVTFAPDDGEPAGLTVNQAIESLMPKPEAVAGGEQTQEEPAEGAEDGDPAGDEGSEGDDQAPEDAEGGEEDPAEGESETEEETEPAEALEPPKYWSKDAKAKFAELSPELQAVVLAQEGPREEAAAKAKAEAAEKVKAADAEVAKVAQLAQGLAEFLPQAIQTFANRWGADPDWVAYAKEHGAEAMTLAKAQYDSELGELQKVAKANADAAELAHQAYVKAEFAKLADVAPDLADPEKGKERRTATTKFLVEQGVEPDSLKNISAVEMAIAYDAMRFREAQAKLKAAKPLPKPNPTPKKPAGVRPGASAASSPQAAAAKSAEGRFHAKPSVDNAVAYLLSRKG